MFTLEWDDEEIDWNSPLSEKENLHKSRKNNINTHHIPESRRNRNGRPIRPLMQTLPYSLVKQNSSPPSNVSSVSIIHAYNKNHQIIKNDSNSSGKIGNYETQQAF